MLRPIGWIAASLLVCLSAGHYWASQSFWLQTGGGRELCQNDFFSARELARSHPLANAADEAAPKGAGLLLKIVRKSDGTRQ